MAQTKQISLNSGYTRDGKLQFQDTQLKEDDLLQPESRERGLSDFVAMQKCNNLGTRKIMMEALKVNIHG